MTGSARTIRSPSTLTSTRSTPWVAGCWGPTLRTISSVWRPPVLERSGTRVRSSGTVPIRSAPSSQGPPGRSLFLVLGPRPGLVPAAGQLEGAAQRVPLEGFRQGGPHKGGGVGAGDPEHL